MFKNTTESMGLKEKDYKLSFILRNLKSNFWGQRENNS